MKTALDQYVRNGGTLLVLAQQYDTHFENLVPIPEGETLKAFGWRQDQSCINGSVYFENMHPVLSSSLNEQVTAAVDGYFTQWPSNATVLLNRTKNREAALLHYPYGNGHVILTSLYTDWGHAHSQASASELRIVRDLISFARNPNLSIPMYNLDNNLTPGIELNVSARNDSEEIASRAKVTVYTPDLGRVLFEIEESVALNPGQETSIPVNFVLPILGSHEYGIGQTYYELYNSEGKLIQMNTWTETGRFSIYKVGSAYTPSSGMDMWLTVDDEEVYMDETPVFTLHIKNYTEEDKTIEFNYELDHRGAEPLFALTVPAGGKVVKEIPVENEPDFVRFSIYPSTGSTMIKGIYRPVATDTVLEMVGTPNLGPGQPLNYTITSAHKDASPSPGDYGFKVVLEKYDSAGHQYTETAVLQETVNDFSLDQTFNYSGSHTEQLTLGQYRLRVNLTNPGGHLETTKLVNFYVQGSGFQVQVGMLQSEGEPVSYILPGRSYTIPFTFFNTNGPNDYDVKNGKITLVLQAPTGQEVYRKEIAGIPVARGEVKPMEETFTFTPTQLGTYRVTYRYWDETRERPQHYIERGGYHYRTSLTLLPDKTEYHLLETARMSAKIIGTGTYTVDFTCIEAGITEQRTITLSAGGIDHTEQFDVPMGQSQFYNVKVVVKDMAGTITEASRTIRRQPLKLDYSVNFSDTIARAGSPLELDVLLKVISGVVNPLPGDLRVSCAGLNSSESRAVTLVPGPDGNRFLFPVQVPVEAAPGLYTFDIRFSINGVDYFAKTASIYLPDGRIGFVNPGNRYDAGDTFTLDMANEGGKPGPFQLDILLKDPNGKEVFRHEESKVFSIGEQHAVQVAIPAGVKGGTYLLAMQAKNTDSGQLSLDSSAMEIIGLSATLNSYTLKDVYLNDEAVTGKAEITAGAGGISEGLLKARMYRKGALSGAQDLPVGDFLNYNYIESGYDAGDYLYMVTDKGVLKYAKSGGAVEMLYAFDGFNPEFNARKLLLSGTGDLWIATSGYGIFRIGGSGQWSQFTIDDGVGDFWVYDIMEVEGAEGTEIWAATLEGISVYHGGQWQTYTTADGLPHNRVSRLAMDGSGAIWASTRSGVSRFNRITGQFEEPLASFGTVDVGELLAGTADGGIWAVEKIANGDFTLHRYYSGTWETWRINELYEPYSVYVHSLEVHNGELWIKGNFSDGQSDIRMVLIHYGNSSGFSFYNSIDHPELGGLMMPYIMAGGNDSGSAYFIGEIGFIELSGGQTAMRYIDIDKDKLLASVNCMAVDNQSRVWLGTAMGVSVYDGTRFTHFFLDAHYRTLMETNGIAVGPDGTVFALNPAGIQTFDLSGPGDLMEYPDNDYYYMNHQTLMTVDTTGRIWIGRKYFHYYDGAQWQLLSSIRYSKTLTQDGQGGVWVGNVEYSPEYAFHIRHIKHDLTVDDYTYLNSGLIEGEKDHLYVDTYGRLWVNTFNYKNKGYTNNPMQSFDGQDWVDYRGYENFPADEQYGISSDGAGNIVLLAFRNSEEGMRLFTLADGKFTMGDQTIGSEFTPELGKLVSAGGKYYGVNGNLIEISASGGALGEEVLWSKSVPLEMSSGSSQTLALDSVSPLQPGVYFLRTSVLSQSNQILAEKSSSFSVGDNQLSVTLLPGNTFEGSVRPGTQLSVGIDVKNNTTESKTGLLFKVKKVSPDGIEQELISEAMDLSPGQSLSRGIVFNESALGTWKLVAQLYGEDDNGGGGGGEVPVRLAAADELATASEEEPGATTPTDLLSETTMFIDVARPSMTMTLQAPEYAGDDPAAVQIQLTNESSISSTVTVKATSGGSNLLNQTVTLKPGEEQLLSFNDTINADKTYNVTVSGDVSKNETVTVKYGYNETVAFNILPSYREGPVTIGYTIGNFGGLAFSDTLHMELYTVGGSAPLHTFDRTYNLYPLLPEDQPTADSIDLNLAPGNYILKTSSGKLPAIQESLFTVNPSGIGTVALLSQTTVYPVGSGEPIGFSVTNSDTVAGAISVALTLTGPQGPVTAQNRSYFLQPGQTVEDFIAADFAVPGNYSLSISGSKLSAPLIATLQAAEAVQVNASLTLGTIENGTIPVGVTAANSGFQSFTGTVQLTVTEDGITHEETVTASPGDSFSGNTALDVSVLTPGEKTVTAVLLDASGTVIAQTSGTVTVLGPDIELDVPESLTVDAGSFADVPLALRNNGHQRGEVVLEVSALESLHQQREIALEPGQELVLENITLDAASDLPSGNYPFNYSIKGTNGTQSGKFNITVNGLDIDVDASLDRSLYNEGETATLTVTVNTSGTSDAPLEAVINWGNFNERRKFNLSSGSATLTFNIPLDEQRDEKVFYGVYHDGGKGIHLNDIYLNFRGDVSVELDKQVYAPGEVIQAVFTSQQSGVLTAEAFGESHTINLSGSASASFQVPQDTLGGTYGVSWNLTPADTSQSTLSGSQRFDVSGLVVKTAKSELDKGKYNPGETITATYLFESNQNASLELRSWVTSPSGEWQYLGSGNVSVSGAQLTETQNAFSFDTTEAGTHEWVYGLYKLTATEEKLVLSGRMAFDVGDAVLMGVTTDKYEYKTGAETVKAKVHYFGQGNAQLELYLDGEKIEDRSLTINSVGITEISIISSRLTGGSHSLRTVLTKDGLTSAKTTGFIYGTELPDLTVSVLDTSIDNLSYTYRLSVTNSGKTAAAASSMTFSDNDSVIQTLSVPALQPTQSHEVTVTWSGSGKAGSHAFVFKADSGNTVKEYSESNNTIEFSEEITALFYTLEAEPVLWPANFNATLITRLINNQDSPLPVTLEMSIANDETGEEIFQRTKLDTIPAFGNKTITDTFNSGVYAAGQYTIRQTLSAPSVDDAREIYVTIEADKSMEISLTIDPITIPSDTPSETALTLGLSNTGNVPLENEVLMIEVFDKGLEEVVKSEEYLLSLGIAETRTETKVLPLTLAEGQYEIRLKYEEAVLASAELTSAPGLEREKVIAVSPRPLIMNLSPTPQHNQEMQFLNGLFSLQELDYDFGTKHTESFVKLHKNHSNITVVVGNLSGDARWQEIQERVWSGEGLILVYDKPMQDEEKARFFGLMIKPAPGKEKEKIVSIEASDLCNGGDVTLADRVKNYIEPISDDVTVLAKTTQNQRPVMALRKYGMGHVLAITMPLQFTSGGETAAQLIANAVTTFSRDVYTQSDISRVLPIGVSLTNRSSKTLSLTVKEILPYGVEAYGFDPEPEPKSSDTDDTTWKVELGAGTQEVLHYWLRLPDGIGSYEAMTEIYEGETKRDDVSVTFEVAQTVAVRIDELIQAIEMLDATGADAGYLNTAKTYLQQVLDRTGNSIGDIKSNVADMVNACVNLGKAETTDVTSLRLQAIAVLRVVARKHYDKTVN